MLANNDWKMDIMPEIMDGKNIADFIDPDIAEKSEALECEEDMVESKDEHEGIEARVALSHKIKSQSLKKSKKNQSRLARSTGLATLTHMAAQLTKAGLDPNRIVDRAAVDCAAVISGKRKSDDEDVHMEDGEVDGRAQRGGQCTRKMPRDECRCGQEAGVGRWRACATRGKIL
ncbi:hypothetical protein C8R44DRAFT_758504 [Mycena epipterygia]|nr:hypothetical protein C8R44DRAFT_758504 [Mycena epipterygia]